MKWLDRKIDEFIRKVRDAQPNPLKVGRLDNPTYHRYFLIPRNLFFNIYLHHFFHDDEQDPHDHRMLNISIPLQGEYYEERFTRRPKPRQPLPLRYKRLTKNHSITIRFAKTPHRVILRRDENDKPIPMWSLFIGFPQFRNWGFWCPNQGSARWVRQEIYLKNKATGSAGYGYESNNSIQGCGE